MTAQITVKAPSTRHLLTDDNGVIVVRRRRRGEMQREGGVGFRVQVGINRPQAFQQYPSHFVEILVSRLEARDKDVVEQSPAECPALGGGAVAQIVPAQNKCRNEYIGVLVLSKYIVL